MDEPRRFTRGRLSRGKGLRKTTGCLTCRRRRVKCDEGKPRCGGCTRKKSRCEYASSQEGTRRTREPPDANGHGPTQVPARINGANVDESGHFNDTTTPPVPTSAQQHAQPPGEPEGRQGPDTNLSQSPESALHDRPGSILRHDHLHAGRIVNVQAGNIVNRQMGYYDEEPSQANLTSQDCYGTGIFTNFHSTVYEITSPIQVPLHLTPLPYSSTEDSGIGNGAECLTSRWLDLLIGDATLNYGPLPEFQLDTNGADIFGNSVTQTPEPIGEADTLPTDVGRPTSPDVQTGKSTVVSKNPDLIERTSNLIEPLREKEQAWQALEPIQLQTQEHILFRHFTEHISRWMDLFEPQKPFGTLVPHLALRNVGLMNAILALSARHLFIVNHHSPSHAAGPPPNPNDTINYYYKTLHYSQKAIQYESYRTSLELLTSAIIISTYEMLDGSSTDWEKHLKGVFWIQRSQVIHGDSGGLRQAVWWAWLCQDVWAAFREKRKPFTFWKPTRPLVELNPCELAARAVYNFAHVVGFCAKEDASGNLKDINTRTQEANRLFQKLQQWRSHLTVEFNPLPSSDAQDKLFPQLWIQPPVFGVSMQIYYCSLILLSLHRPWCGGFNEYLDRQRTLKRWASTVCGIAKTCTDYASSVMTSQCVFIAGMVIEDSSQRSAVLELLDACDQRAGWPGYSLGRELNDIWRTD